MANSKISALTSATTPLAGTETLPIVQSSTTKQVSVANLTAGRAVSATSIALNGAASALTPAFIRNGSFSCSPFGADYQMATFGAYNDDLTNGGFVLSGLVANVVTEIARGGTNGITFKNNLIQATAAKGINFTANTPASGMTSQLLNWYEAGTWTPGQGANLTVVGAFSSAGKYTRIGRQVTVYGSLTGATSVAITGGISEMFTGLPFAPADGTSFVITNSNYSAGGFGRTAGTAGYCITTFAAIGTLYFTITYQMA
ncbi:hypothetical protein UFOVP133_41 [uncultured Caudovirales phage]|uniref:Uncharacterized protein n=1 Tax=uncultured Caudovirales phage TaxID=2100421 RepID=A0A6J5LAM2_9CAUD|nr:hypothetical protein UFOVP133_41 [uncultured Caudovirales phage]